MQKFKQKISKYSRLETIKEGFEARRAEKGEVKFSAHTMDDPHIKKAIEEIAKISTKTKDQVKQEIEEKIAEFKNTAAKAPLLYNTILQNIVENETFDAFKNHKVELENTPLFNKSMFDKLLDHIKADHDGGIYPLASYINPKRMYEITNYFIPDPKTDHLYPEYTNPKSDNYISTAAALGDGTFFFNKKFMQHLIDFAVLKGAKGKGAKYENIDPVTGENTGGEIPNCYCYIEFVILHEWMHYIYDDFYHGQRIKPEKGLSRKTHNLIINWVGDFRSNYTLVKSGYSQLPMGLFNDDINLDRQNDYISMYKLVLAEFKKLQPDDQEKVKKFLEENGDDHEWDEEGEPGEDDGGEDGVPGKGNGKGKGKPGKDKDGGEEGEGEGEDGQPSKNKSNKQGKAKMPEGGWPSEEELDEYARKVHEKTQQRKDNTSEEVAKNIEKQQNKKGEPLGSAGGRSGKGTDDDGYADTGYKKIPPHYNWEELISKFINSGEFDTITTYTKLHRNMASQVHTGSQLGGAVPKPGEKKIDVDSATLCFCIDSSGSMTGVIGKIFAEIKSLLENNSQLGACEMTFINYSNSFEIFKGTFNENKAGRVSDVTEAPNDYDTDIDTLFSRHIGNGTTFDHKLVEQLHKLLEEKYNVLIFTDSDIFTDRNNLLDFLRLLKDPKNGQVFVVFDSADTFHTFTSSMKYRNDNITYFS